MYCTGLRIVHNLSVWDDFTTLVLSREKSIYDYLFSYWRRLVHHLLSSDEALAFQMTWSAYLNITSPVKNWWKTTGYRKNSVFLRRLRNQIKHCIIDWIEFDSVHIKQYDCFRKTNNQINSYIYKYFLHPPEIDN
jgi:hypothetical protein